MATGQGVPIPKPLQRVRLPGGSPHSGAQREGLSCRPVDSPVISGVKASTRLNGRYVKAMPHKVPQASLRGRRRRDARAPFWPNYGGQRRFGKILFRSLLKPGLPLLRN
eukprot:scaffold10248_cov65-Phaeocystis_antarctica.AAC.15